MKEGFYMSLPRRTFIFSQKPLDKDDIAEIAAAINIEEATEFIHPTPNITVAEVLKDLNNFSDFDSVIFADQDTHGLYNLTELLKHFVEYLEKYTSPETKLSDATMAYLVFE